MISILEPLAALGLLTLASDPSSVCRVPKPVDIRVTPKTSKVKYDISQTRDEIQKYNIDTVNPYGFDAKTHTNGFMRGLIKMQPFVKLDYKYVYQNQAVCIWYEKVELKIEIEPEIVIAKEVASDRCEYSAVKEHELKHVMVDRKIVNKYAKTMGKKVYEGLKSRGFVVGPIRPEAAEAVAKRMQETVGQLVELEYQKMSIERQERQQAVDSLEEYERVNSLCDKPTGASRSRR